MIPPSGIALASPFPLVGTLGRLERELAAAMLVRVCQVRGDRWQIVTREALHEVVEAEIAARAEPWVHLARNPFVPPPDYADLVIKGHAVMHEDGAAIELLERTITLLAERHPARLG